MGLIYAREARAELHDAVKFYEAARSGLGAQFLSTIERAVEQIERNPTRWRKYSGRFRRYLVRRFPYAIVYATEGDDLLITAIMHLKRDPNYWKGRFPS